MEKIATLTVAEYLEKMAVCDFPGPAAGSAAATAVAMAAALLQMSCDGSLRKHGDNPLLQESLNIGATIRSDCLRLADEDMIAYGQVIVAAKHKNDDRTTYETAMKGATEPFIHILRHCHRLLCQIEKVIAGSFSRVLGDLVGGAYLAEAAAAAAKSGISVNLMLIHDDDFTSRCQSEAKTRYEACLALKAAILEQVFKAPETANDSDGQGVLDFWFDPQHQPFWFAKNDDFDQTIHERFYDLWLEGSRGHLWHWRTTLKGRLAEIIVLDQFSRNLFRDGAAAFAQDHMALILAQEALVHPDFPNLPKEYQKFILMPFMHSESARIHELARPYFEALEDPLTLAYEIRHQTIISRFGRYPHRNELLMRESTPEELAFLKEPDSHF